MKRISSRKNRNKVIDSRRKKADGVKADEFIRVQVFRNKDNMVEKIEYADSSEPYRPPENTGAVFVFHWDPKKQESTDIALWAKGMLIPDMYAFIVQTLFDLGDTMERATTSKKMPKLIRKFAKNFTKKGSKDLKKCLKVLEKKDAEE